MEFGGGGSETGILEESSTIEGHGEAPSSDDVQNDPLVLQVILRKLETERLVMRYGYERVGQSEVSIETLENTVEEILLLSFEGRL